jgi:outer membrane protein assembly factor BamE (lipoprotein component of BamABCDE complex)
MINKRNRLFSGLGILVILAIFSTPVFSQSLDQKVKELEKKIAQLEQRIVKLEETIVQLQKSQAKPAVSSPNKWKDKANWRLLRKGMTKNDVEQVLGTPPKVVANAYYGDIWYYPDLQGGFASFDKENLLSSWNEIE